jgi:hypothetical protein
MGEESARITVETIRCSFCEKLRDQVAFMIQGPGVRICDECTDLVSDILEDKLPTWPWRRTREWALPQIEPRRRSPLSMSESTGPNTQVTVPPELEDELTRLWIDFKNLRATGDMSGLRALIEHYHPLADHYVGGLVLDREVFAREAQRALVMSIMVFDERRGEPFETVALRAIQDTIYQTLTDTLEIPKHLP